MHLFQSPPQKVILICRPWPLVAVSMIKISLINSLIDLFENCIRSPCFKCFICLFVIKILLHLPNPSYDCTTLNFFCLVMNTFVLMESYDHEAGENMKKGFSIKLSLDLIKRERACMMHSRVFTFNDIYNHLSFERASYVECTEQVFDHELVDFCIDRSLH